MNTKTKTTAVCGLLLALLLLGFTNTAQALNPAEQFLEGFAIGFEIEIGNVTECIHDAMNIATLSDQFYLLEKEGFNDRSMKELYAGFKVLPQLAQEIALGLQQCGLISFAQRITNVVKEFESGPEGVIKIIIGEVISIFHNHNEITGDIRSGIAAYKSGDYTSAGVSFGEVVEILLPEGGEKIVFLDNAHAAEQFLEGFALGFETQIGNVAQCVQDSMKMIQDIDTFYTDVKQGFDSKSIKQIYDGFQVLPLVVADVKLGVQQCGMVQLAQRLEQVIAAFKQGPAGVIKIVVKEGITIFHHDKDIYSYIESGITAFKSQQYSTSGFNFGKLVGVLLPSPSEVAALNSNTTRDAIQFLEGFALGFETEIGNVAECLQDAIKLEQDVGTFYVDMKQGFADKSAKDLYDGFRTLPTVVKDISAGVQQCGLTNLVKQLAQVVEQLKSGPEGIIKIVGGEILRIFHNGKEITGDIKGGVEAFENHDYSTAGLKFGEVAGLLLPTASGMLTSPLTPAVQFMEGFALGFETEIGNVAQCLQDGEQLVSDFSDFYESLDKGFQDRSAKELYDGLKEIPVVAKEISLAVQQCGFAQLAQRIAQVVQEFKKGPEGVFHIVINEVVSILHNEKDLSADIQQGLAAFKRQDYTTCGVKVGQLIGILLPSP